MVGNIFKTSDLKKIQEEVIHSLITKQLSDFPLVTCLGYLSDIPQTSYSKYFEIPLTEDGETILLDIPKRLVEQFGLKAGDYVSVTGAIFPKIYRGVITFRLDVTSLCLTDTPQAIIRKQEDKIKLDQLLSLQKSRNFFPSKKGLKITLIYPRASKAKIENDFLSSLSEISKNIFIDHKPVSIVDPYEIATAIANSSCDVLAIIRGGGDNEQLDIFNNQIIVKPLAVHKAFRIVGVGHSANYSLTDLIADYSAVTPTAAGSYIKEQYLLKKKQWFQLENLNKKIAFLKFINKALICLTTCCLVYSVILYKNNESKTRIITQVPSSITKKISHNKLKKIENNEFL